MNTQGILRAGTEVIDYADHHSGTMATSRSRINPYKLAETFAANPTWFTENKVTSETFRINNSERVIETVTAYYLQLEGKFLNNRLEVITGTRYEKTHDRGETVLFQPDAIWQRNADGSYVDGDPITAGVQRVRRADAGAAGSMEELKLTRIERGNRPNRSYDDYYPSFNTKYNLTDNLVIRAGWAVTMGR